MLLGGGEEGEGEVEDGVVAIEGGGEVHVDGTAVGGGDAELGEVALRIA
jgi:hypothetical protein